MELIFTKSAYKDYLYWKKHDPKIFERITILCKAIMKDSFLGIGKPEPLKYDFQGCWSRRINRTHRLVYRIEDESCIIISCRFHY